MLSKWRPKSSVTPGGNPNKSAAVWSLIAVSRVYTNTKNQPCNDHHGQRNQQKVSILVSIALKCCLHVILFLCSTLFPRKRHVFQHLTSYSFLVGVASSHLSNMFAVCRYFSFWGREKELLHSCESFNCVAFFICRKKVLRNQVEVIFKIGAISVIIYVP